MVKKFKLNSDKKDNPLKNNSLYMKTKLIEGLVTGLDIDSAAKLSGISNNELNFLRADPEFEELIQSQEIKFEFENLVNIKTAGDMGAWQAASWLLERRFPDKYGKKDVIKHEYEFKLQAFQNIVVRVINKLPSDIKQMFLQELRTFDLNSQVDNLDNLPVVSKKGIV